VKALPAQTMVLSD